MALGDDLKTIMELKATDGWRNGVLWLIRPPVLRRVANVARERANVAPSRG